MYKPIRFRLTLLSGITITILFLIMSLGYLYITENNMINTKSVSTINDMSTLSTILQPDSNVSFSLLSKIEMQGNYLISIYENDKPTLYQTISMTKENEELRNQAYEYYQKEEPNLEKRFLTNENKLVYFEMPGNNHYEFFVITFNSDPNIKILMLACMDNLYNEIRNQRLVLLPLTIIILCILWIFLWFFNGKILYPIEVNRKEQVAFFASASHELRTPLAVIFSCVEGMEDLLLSKKRDERSYSDLENYANISKRESKRMAKLLEDMLTISTNESNGFKITKTDVELDTITLTTYEAFEVMAAKKKIRLSVELPDDIIPTCQCDEGRITQVLAILVNNAISYTPENGTVKLALSYEKNQFHFSISDSGMGISDDEKEHIFKKFYRSEKARSEKGHFGLGLAIASDIVKAHHGKIYITDGNPCGAVFHVILY